LEGILVKQLSLLAWKEWHEIRAFFWIAIGIFIGLPVIGGIEEFAQHGHFVLLASPWVFGCGAVLAVFVAVGAACRDFHSHLEDFWRSRPVSVTRWLLVKYAVGLGVVLLVCALPLMLEIIVDHDVSVIFLLVAYPFLWIAVFSISFLAGCLVRRPAQAAMLALAAMLLVYCLPTVLPPLAWLDIWSVTETRAYWDWNGSVVWDQLWDTIRAPKLLEFAGGMLAIGAVALISALVAARRDWRLESGRKMMYGSVSCAVLIISSSAAYRLGTNLPILQQVDLPANEGDVRQFEFSGNHGYIVLLRNISQSSVEWVPRYTLHAVDLTSAGLQIGPGERIDAPSWGPPWAARTTQHPEFEYETTIGLDATPTTDNHYYLWVYESGRHVKSIQLPLQFETAAGERATPRPYAWDNRLFVYGSRLLTFDITDPALPRLISQSDLELQVQHQYYFDGEEKVHIPLAELPDIPPAAKLDAAISGFFGGVFDGQTLCRAEGNAMVEYRLVAMTDTAASFRKVAEYDPTILERMFGFFNRYTGNALSDGLLYCGQGYGGGTFNPHITVFDTRGTNPLRVVGHFAAPGKEMMVCPLPDGRALVAGDKLWLVGPPPHAAGN
jgi:hypothetical protein